MHKDRLFPPRRENYAKGILGSARFHLARTPYRLDRLRTRYGWALSQSEKRIASLRNCHQGERIFILGNGPSLNTQDLTALHEANAITMASNKIYLAFDQTPWRPTYYTVIDVLVAENNYQEIQSLDLHKLFSAFVYDTFQDDMDVTWLRHLQHPFFDGQRQWRFSTNPVEGLYGGWSVIYHQMQLAYFMGAAEVVLLGLDFSFAGGKVTQQTSASGDVLEGEGEVNHFHKDYRKPGETWTVPRLDLQKQAFACARKAFEGDGRRVINASRTTKLDIFEMGNFDDILQSMNR